MQRPALSRVSQLLGDSLEVIEIDATQRPDLAKIWGVMSVPTTFLLDARGEARFVTVYPGWYPGRAVHIHFNIRTDPDADAGFEFTSQLFFDDALSQQVYASGVYASKGQPIRL